MSSSTSTGGVVPTHVGVNRGHRGGGLVARPRERAPVLAAVNRSSSPSSPVGVVAHASKRRAAAGGSGRSVDSRCARRRGKMWAAARVAPLGARARVAGGLRVGAALGLRVRSVFAGEAVTIFAVSLQWLSRSRSRRCRQGGRGLWDLADRGVGGRFIPRRDESESFALEALSTEWFWALGLGGSRSRWPIHSAE